MFNLSFRTVCSNEWGLSSIKVFYYYLNGCVFKKDDIFYKRQVKNQTITKMEEMNKDCKGQEFHCWTELYDNVRASQINLFVI